jgi:hypothetical protein
MKEKRSKSLSNSAATKQYLRSSGLGSLLCVGSMILKVDGAIGYHLAFYRSGKFAGRNVSRF